MKKVSIIIGPGQHGGEIEAFLFDEGLLQQKLVMFPKLTSTLYKDSKKPLTRVIPIFGVLEHLIWGVWVKLPILKKFRTPESITFAIADRLLSNEIVYSEVFIGWCMVSLHCMRRARELGSRLYLEYPMTQVDEWMELVKAEYAAWGQNSGYHSLIPNSIVERTRQECEEADKIIVHSNFVKSSFIRRGTSEDKLILTELGIDNRLFPRKGDYNVEGPLKILYVGRVELLKGIQYLLKSISTFPKEKIEVHLVGRVLPEFAPILKKYHDIQIILHGEVPHEQLPSIYREADIFAFPSINDSFGMVVLEAMASGLPVIATENSCGPNVITDGKDGFVIAIRDDKALSACIQYFLDNRELIQEMGRRASDKVAGKFTTMHYRERLAAIYSAT